MDIATQLFEGRLICLTAIDPEKDAEIESRWTHNPLYLRMLDPLPALPLSPARVKKKYEAIEKEAEEDKNLFHFAVRTQPGGSAGENPAENPSRLVGFARLQWIMWNHGEAHVQLGIGDPSDWRKGYGAEVLRLLARFAFSELNLFRLSAIIPEYNQAALGLFEQAGYRQEVCRREAVERDGRRWDLFHYGLLREEWDSRVAQAGQGSP